MHTQRFALYVGQRCRSGTIKDVTAELHLDRHTVKRLEKHYMLEWLKRAGAPHPRIIGPGCPGFDQEMIRSYPLGFMKTRH